MPKMRKKRERKKRRKEYVHGLYVLVPVRDFHLTYIIKALRDLALKYEEEKKIAHSKYCISLANLFSEALSQLIKVTKIYNQYLKHRALFQEPPVKEKKIIKFEIYLDPDYMRKK